MSDTPPTLPSAVKLSQSEISLRAWQKDFKDLLDRANKKARRLGIQSDADVLRILQ